MVLSPTILPRLGRLVRLLGSPVDGEALGAARALDRTLAAAGLTIHDLAEAVEQPRKTRTPRAPRTPQAPQDRQPAGILRWSLDRRITVARTLRQGISGGVFNDWESQFANDIIGQILSPSRPRDLSVKQAETVNALLAKVAEASR